MVHSPPPPPSKGSSPLLSTTREMCANCKIGSAFKSRRLFAWVYWLNPRRWLRKNSRRARLGSTAPVIPPINVGDRLFLESLVRHVEENSLYPVVGGSTAPLLYSGSAHRPSSEFGYGTSTYGAMYARGSSDVPTKSTHRAPLCLRETSSYFFVLFTHLLPISKTLRVHRT